MAISRERRTALAELMVATTQMNTAKLMLRDDSETHESIATMLDRVVECVKRAREEILA